jgi:hypothetical protein
MKSRRMTTPCDIGCTRATDGVGASSATGDADRWIRGAIGVVATSGRCSDRRILGPSDVEASSGRRIDRSTRDTGPPSPDIGLAGDDQADDRWTRGGALDRAGGAGNRGALRSRSGPIRSTDAGASDVGAGANTGAAYSTVATGVATSGS